MIKQIKSKYFGFNEMLFFLISISAKYFFNLVPYIFSVLNGYSEIKKKKKCFHKHPLKPCN